MNICHPRRANGTGAASFVAAIDGRPDLRDVARARFTGRIRPERNTVVEIERELAERFPTARLDRYTERLSLAEWIAELEIERSPE